MTEENVPIGVTWETRGLFHKRRVGVVEVVSARTAEIMRLQGLGHALLTWDEVLERLGHKPPASPSPPGYPTPPPLRREVRGVKFPFVPVIEGDR